MSDIQLALSLEEAEFLVAMLHISLTSKRVEIHRTDSLAYRRDLEHEAGILEGLVKRLELANSHVETAT